MTSLSNFEGWPETELPHLNDQRSPKLMRQPSNPGQRPGWSGGLRVYRSSWCIQHNIAARRERLNPYPELTGL